MRTYSKIGLFCAIGLVVVSASCSRQQGIPSHVTLMKENERWQLLVNGKPFYIKGFVGAMHFDEAQQAGANSVRVWMNRQDCADSALKYGFTVLMGLPVYGERDGMNWENDSLIREQKAKVLEMVNRFKNHPSILMWVLGNELDWIPPGKPYNIKMWKILDQMAEAIHAIDPHHPVMTVIGDSYFEQKVKEIDSLCPHLDLLGINGYGALGSMCSVLQHSWGRPYVVTEWGVTGYWEVPKTSWGVPLEENSTLKARRYLERYRNIILLDTFRCLGSYVFFWQPKQETTHTWFGMFDEDGRSSEAVDVMQYLWSGLWPKNRAPRIDTLYLSSTQRFPEYLFRPGENVSATIFASDPDGDSLRYAWEVKPEVQQGFYAGSGEIPALPVPDVMVDSTKQQVNIRIPDISGAYRLFVYVYDSDGHFATGNIPFYVRK